MHPSVPGGNPALVSADERPTTMVTPEAVVLDLPTAAIASRCLARFLDLLIELVALSVILILPAVLGAGDTVVVIVASFVSVLAIFGYPAIWEALWRGRTPGKAALGLRVVTADGAPIGPRHAILRSVMGPVDLVAGVESMLVSPRDRRIGDVVAGTVVLRDKLPMAPGTGYWFSAPVGLEAYAASLDTRLLTANDQAVIRSFLLRWPEFSDGSRWALAAALAGPLRARLRHPIPPGLPPDLYLMTVLAARQRRDYDAQQGQRGSQGQAYGAPPPWAPPAGSRQPSGAPAWVSPAPSTGAPTVTGSWGPPAGGPPLHPGPPVPDRSVPPSAPGPARPGPAITPPS